MTTPILPRKNKITTEDYVLMAKAKHEDYYDYSRSVYKGMAKKVKFFCPVHGEIEREARQHLKGSACHICTGWFVGKDNFLSRSREVHGNKFDYDLENFHTLRSRIKLKCNICGYEFEQYARRHLEGHGCKNCQYNAKRLGFDKFVEMAKEIHGESFSYEKAAYKNNLSLMTIVCNKCGETFIQSAGSHLAGHGCKKCGLEKLRISLFSDTSRFIASSQKKHNDKFLYDKVSYVNEKTEVCLTCKIHGDFLCIPEWHLTLVNGGCRKCGKESIISTHRLSQDEFLARAINLHKDRFDYSKAIYHRYHEDVRLICNICKKEFSISVAGHLGGSGCPLCWKSIGEKEVERFLLLNQICHEREKTFPSCRNKHVLRFDFWLPSFNTCIEYNGGQHYEANNFFGGQDGLKSIQHRDQIKRDWCANNGIKLIEVPYTVTDIEDFLLKHLE